MFKKTKLSAERLREVLGYNPDTGLFFWKVRLSNRASLDRPAGSAHRPSGYRFISVDNESYKEHRLAWLYMTGTWPEDQIDHINGIRSDNRWCNLREATASMNQQNLRAARGETESGILGVYRSDKKYKPWRACIKIADKWCQIGNFRTPGEAHEAYLAAKRKHHEGCTI